MHSPHGSTNNLRSKYNRNQPNPTTGNSYVSGSSKSPNVLNSKQTSNKQLNKTQMVAAFVQKEKKLAQPASQSSKRHSEANSQTKQKKTSHHK